MAFLASSPAQPKGATGVIVFADGTTVWGMGFGASGAAVGEVCFNTAMTGYQEVLTDPSYAAQIVTFTFPHIGNVGTNDEDFESRVEGAVGCIVREEVTRQSSFRSTSEFVAVDAGSRQDRRFGRRYPRAHPPHPPERRTQRGDRAFARRASSIWRHCCNARRNGRGWKGWTLPCG